VFEHPWTLLVGWVQALEVTGRNLSRRRTWLLAGEASAVPDGVAAANQRVAEELRALRGCRYTQASGGWPSGRRRRS
jgi:hypothetical protein